MQPGARTPSPPPRRATGTHEPSPCPVPSPGPVLPAPRCPSVSPGTMPALPPDPGAGKGCERLLGVPYGRAGGDSVAVSAPAARRERRWDSGTWGGKEKTHERPRCSARRMQGSTRRGAAHGQLLE